MPTYEYRCNNCGLEFEEFQSMNDEPIKKCPKCSGNVRRLIVAGAGMIFKGSGFYLTDYKKSNSSPSKSDGRSKSTRRSETPGKPEAAPKAKTEEPAKAEKQTK
jgi:putative FmdB family regulatory protein